MVKSTLLPTWRDGSICWMRLFLFVAVFLFGSVLVWFVFACVFNK